MMELMAIVGIQYIQRKESGNMNVINKSSREWKEYINGKDYISAPMSKQSVKSLFNLFCKDDTGSNKNISKVNYND